MINIGQCKPPACVWAITLFPRGSDQVIPQVLVQDQDGRAGQLGEPSVPGAVGAPAGQVGQCPAGLHEAGIGAGADREVGQGLGDVALADSDSYPRFACSIGLFHRSDRCCD
jgi:hypothetical protein